MENTTKVRMSMTVHVEDVSDKSSCIGYVGQGTWFDGKAFIVTQYKANPACWYFFVYNSFVPQDNFFANFSNIYSYGNEIWHLNPDNGNFSGTVYLFSTMTDTLYIPFSISQPSKETSPTFLFEIS
jgi:hypothetical protein